MQPDIAIGIRRDQPTFYRSIITQGFHRANRHHRTAVAADGTVCAAQVDIAANNRRTGSEGTCDVAAGMQPHVANPVATLCVERHLGIRVDIQRDIAPCTGNDVPCGNGLTLVVQIRNYLDIQRAAAHIRLGPGNGANGPASGQAQLVGNDPSEWRRAFDITIDTGQERLSVGVLQHTVDTDRLTRIHVQQTGVIGLELDGDWVVSLGPVADNKRP